MELELASGAVWGTVTGRLDELAMVENTLSDWAKQVNGAAAWIRMDLCGESVLLVMGGVLARLPELLGAEPGVRPDIPLISCIEEDLETLENYGPQGQMEGWLREHQVAAVRAALTAPWGRSILKLPTGAGKTRVAAAIGAVCGGKWLYVVPNEQLLEQGECAFVQANVMMGGSVEWYATTYQRLSNDKTCMPAELRGVIFDECHRLGASSYALGALHVQGPLYRVGLSGTPLDRGDGRNMAVIGLTGPVRYEISIPELQDRGLLARGSVKKIEVDNGRD